MEVKFTATSHELLDTVPISNGQVIATVDSTGYYYDMDGNRFQVNSDLQIDDSSASSEATYSSSKIEELVASLPEPMIFKGSFGEDGTIHHLPPVEGIEGWTYKAITRGKFTTYFRHFSANELFYPFLDSSKFYTAKTDFCVMFNGNNHIVLINKNDEAVSRWAGMNGADTFDCIAIPGTSLYGCEIDDLDMLNRKVTTTVYSASSISEIDSLYNKYKDDIVLPVEEDDTVIASEDKWILIPSGDAPGGTVTSISVEGSANIAVTGDMPITKSGKATIDLNKDITVQRSLTVGRRSDPSLHQMQFTENDGLALDGINTVPTISKYIQTVGSPTSPVYINEGEVAPTVLDSPVDVYGSMRYLINHNAADGLFEEGSGYSIDSGISVSGIPKSVITDHVTYIFPTGTPFKANGVPYVVDNVNVKLKIRYMGQEIVGSVYDIGCELPEGGFGSVVYENEFHKSDITIRQVLTDLIDQSSGGASDPGSVANKIYTEAKDAKYTESATIAQGIAAVENRASSLETRATTLEGKAAQSESDRQSLHNELSSLQSNVANIAGYGLSYDATNKKLNVVIPTGRPTNPSVGQMWIE